MSPAAPRTGDAPPAALAVLLAARGRDAGAEPPDEPLAADVVLTVGAVEDDACAGGTVVRGRAAADDLLARVVGDGDLVVCLQDGPECFAEWRSRSRPGMPAASACAALRLDPAGSIERMLVLSSPPLVPMASEHAGAPATVPAGAGRAMVDRYLERLAANDFTAAVACFTDDCDYSHPPYAPGSPRVQFGSAAELLDGLVTLRGPRQVRATVDRYLQRGAFGFLEGAVPGSPGGSFLASFAFGADGRIRRYATWFCRPGAAA